MGLPRRVWAHICRVISFTPFAGTALLIVWSSLYLAGGAQIISLTQHSGPRTICYPRATRITLPAP